MALNDCYPPDPAYGAGAYRRRIVLHARHGIVTGTILDSYHEMRCTLRHDGIVVSAIDGEVCRAPFTTCPAAPAALAELVGLPLATPRRMLYGAGRPGRNCTHLFDIAALAMGAGGGGGRDAPL